MTLPRLYVPILLWGMLLCGLMLAAEAQETVEQPANELSEIVVTAQKRSERLVDVPASVSSLSADTLAQTGMESVSDIAQLIPAIQIASQGAFSLPFIRGIGTTISGAGFPSNVATYVDGIYRPTGLSNNTQLVDVADLEVLKGPQGTLFGRNATGGAILLTTAGPSFTPAFNTRLSFGSFETTEVGVFATGPLSENLAGSIGADYGYSNGYIRNIYTGFNNDVSYDATVRAKLLWQAADKLRFLLTYEYSNVSDPTGNAQSAYDGHSDGALVPGAVVAYQRGDNSADTIVGHRVTDSRFSLQGDMDLEWATLKSWTGFQDERVFDHFDLDSSSAPLLGSNWHLNEDVLSQEINLNSPTNDQFSWVVGAFYFHDYNWFPRYNLTAAGGDYFNPPVDVFSAGVHTNSGAVYADGTYRFIDRLYLTIGGRYSGDFLEANFTYPPGPYTAFGASWKDFTPRAILRYETTDASNVYFSFSQGYKAGALNAQGGDTTPVKPEKVNAYEVGYKLAGHSIRAETAAYYYDYKDLQVQTINNNVATLQNAAAARIFGAEGNIEMSLGSGFTFTAGGAYTDARYRSFPAANVFRWDPSAGVVALQADDSGKNLILTPTWSGNLTLNYRHPLVGGNMQLTGNYHYQSRIFFDTDNVVDQGGYGTLNLRAGWTTPSEHYTFSVYGKNVTNAIYRNFVLDGNVAFQQLFGRPAEFGAEVRAKF